MTTWMMVVLALYVVAAVLDTAAAARKGKRIFKPVLMPLLMVFVLLDWQMNGHVLHQELLLGLLGGWLGDIFLISDSAKCFAAGLSAFLIGHVFYIVLFVRLFVAGGVTMAAPSFFIPAILYGVFWIGACAVVLPRSEKVLKVPVALYALIILGMSFAALQFALVRPSFGIISFIGSLCFVVSDSVLYTGILRKKQNGLIVMSTYTAAQLLVVLGIVL